MATWPEKLIDFGLPGEAREGPGGSRRASGEPFRGIFAAGPCGTLKISKKTIEFHDLLNDICRCFCSGVVVLLAAVARECTFEKHVFVWRVLHFRMSGVWARSEKEKDF